MQLQLTDEQRAFQKEVRTFVEGEVTRRNSDKNRPWHCLGPPGLCELAAHFERPGMASPWMAG